MKVTVIKDSVIHAQTIYKTGESFELDAAVAISLCERGYVQIEGGKEVVEVMADAGIDTISVPFVKEELEQMERAELVNLAKDLGLKANGKSSDIIQRILEFRASEEIEELADDTDEFPNTDMPE